MIFDDVERCEMSKIKLLGYLNRYVEKLHVPCILLADDRIWREAENLQEDSSTLQSLSCTQEKVIGAAFKIKTRPETVVGELLKTCDENANSWRVKSFSILRKYQADIIEVLDYFDIFNYRALKHVFVEFEHFYSFVPQIDDVEIWSKDDLAGSIVIDFVATCYCHVLGIFQYDDDNIDQSFSDEYALSLMANEFQNDESAPKDDKLKLVEKIRKKLKDKFDNISSNLSLRFISKSYGDYSKKWYDIWKRWLKEAYVDSESLKQTLKLSIWFDKNNEYYRNMMLEYQKLTKKNAELAWEDFNKALDDGLITNPNEIFSFYYTLKWYVKNDLFPYNLEYFEQRMVEYINKFASKIEYEPLHSDQSIREYNSIYEVEECKEFKNKLIEIIDKKRPKTKQFQDLLGMLISSNEQHRNYAEAVFTENFGNHDLLLTKDDANILIDFYKNHEASQLSNIRPIFERRFQKEILLEIEFVEEMIKKIDFEFKQKENGKPLPPNIWCLFYLKRVLNKVLDKHKKDEEELNKAADDLANIKFPE